MVERTVAFPFLKLPLMDNLYSYSPIYGHSLDAALYLTSCRRYRPVSYKEDSKCHYYKEQDLELAEYLLEDLATR